AAPGVAFAAGGHGGGGGHGGFGGHPGVGAHPGFGGHARFRGHPGGHSGFVGHSGHPRFFRGSRGFVVVAPGFGYWPYYPYYAPDYAPAPSGYWYYCPSAGTYYPYVGSCPEAWVPVPGS